MVYPRSFGLLAHGLNACFHFPNANWVVGDSGKNCLIDWISVLARLFWAFLHHSINFYEVPQRSVFSTLLTYQLLQNVTSEVPSLILFSLKTQIGPDGRTRHTCTHALNDQFDI